jgi:hypothetical protein
MSSEMPESERDTELRRMLVATASAAPVRPRRRWSIAAPIAAFALAGALTGAVSAAALNALNAPEDYPPVSVDNMVAEFVHDDTQLFGEPVLINGQGDSTASLGAAPENAVELAVAFRCADPGRFDVLVDGKAAMTITCDEAPMASGGGGSYFTVEDAPTHTLTVSAGDGKRYVVWASWAARAVPPVPSPQQTAAMADGEVSEAEYHAQFDRYAECMTVAGYPLDGVNKSGTIINYLNSGAAVSSGSEGRCYAQEFDQIDMTWQSTHQDNSETDRVFRFCLEAEGLTPGTDAASVWKQIQAADIDPVTCLGYDSSAPAP